MPYRALRACFGSAYVYFLLVDVYGIEPSDTDSFLPVIKDDKTGVEISWTLGAALAQLLQIEVPEN